MGSAFSLSPDNNFTKLQDGRKRLTFKYVKRHRVPPNLKIYRCCDSCCDSHNSEAVYAYHWTAAHCDSEIFGYLIKKSSLQEEYDASVNIRTKSLKTPLMYAALHNKPANVRILVSDLHCEVNSKDSRGQTALHHAARLGFLNVVKELLKSPDIDVNTMDRCENTPLDEAVHYNRREIADCLKRRGASFVDVRESSWRRSYRSCTSTLDSGLQDLLRDNSLSSNKFGSLSSQQEVEEERLSVVGFKVGESSMDKGTVATAANVHQKGLEDEMKHTGDHGGVDTLDEDQVDSGDILGILDGDQVMLGGVLDILDEEEGNTGMAEGQVNPARGTGETFDDTKMNSEGGSSPADEEQVTLRNSSAISNEDQRTQNTLDEDQVTLRRTSDTLDEAQVHSKGSVRLGKEGDNKTEVKTHEVHSEKVQRKAGSLEGNHQTDSMASPKEYENLPLDQEPIVVTAEVHAEREAVSCYDRRLETSRVPPPPSLRGSTIGHGADQDLRNERKVDHKDADVKRLDQNGLDRVPSGVGTPTSITRKDRMSLVCMEQIADPLNSKAKRTSSSPTRSRKKAILCPA